MVEASAAVVTVVGEVVVAVTQLRMRRLSDAADGSHPAKLQRLNETGIERSTGEQATSISIL